MSNKPDKRLGILGGLGPMASVYFYQLLTEHTKAERDQEHLNLVLSSKPATPDRTAFILGQSNEDPFAVMEAEAQNLVAYGAEVLAIPCNTAHYFYTRLAQLLPVPVLNMVELTVDKAAVCGCQQLGILATSGTVQTEIYQKACTARGLACMAPTAARQADVMEVIYIIKAGRRPNLAAFNAAASELWAAGCRCIVLGCTELSLLKRDGAADDRFLDSMDVLAEAAIRACGKIPVGFKFPQQG